MDDRDILRRVRIAPYLPGQGPTWDLVTWDPHSYYNGGPQRRVGYDFRQTGSDVALFKGEDFGCSPLHAADSDDCLRSLLSFLTLRPGDTDADYFEHYTPAQLLFVEEHAETVGALFVFDAVELAEGEQGPVPFEEIDE